MGYLNLLLNDLEFHAESLVMALSRYLRRADSKRLVQIRRRSRNVLGARLPPPNPESLGTNLVISAGGDQVAAWMEVTVDECVSRKEMLGLPR
jgi:hypothetical protein